MRTEPAGPDRNHHLCSDTILLLAGLDPVTLDLKPGALNTSLSETVLIRGLNIIFVKKPEIDVKPHTSISLINTAVMSLPQLPCGDSYPVSQQPPTPKC